MAKKAKGKKGSSRKSSSRKKSTGKRVAKRTARKAASKPSSREPAPRASTRKSAPVRKATPAASATASKPLDQVQGPPTVTVNPNNCTISPTGDVHAPGANQNGFVNFNATDTCTVNFTDSTVFGVSSQPLSQGNNKLYVQCDSGSTYVTIAGCPDTTDQKMKGLGDPTDIIVP